MTTTPSPNPLRKALKPCPFCGAPAEYDSRRWHPTPPPLGTTGHAVYCSSMSCNAENGIHETEEDAIEAWNTRSALVADDAAGGWRKAVADVVAERVRQTSGEGWDAEHDDQHIDGSLSMAAALYAAPCALFAREDGPDEVRFFDPWPWWNDDGYRSRVKAWDKRAKHSRRRQLVIAAALIVAEIERLDRLPPAPAGADEKEDGR